ncbi:MAG: hypothetical protein ACI8XZ_002862 [Gammaproteobacteria bacterium]|jgi:hypothetical protein
MTAYRGSSNVDFASGTHFLGYLNLGDKQSSDV